MVIDILPKAGSAMRVLTDHASEIEPGTVAVGFGEAGEGRDENDGAEPAQHEKVADAERLLTRERSPVDLAHREAAEQRIVGALAAVGDWKGGTG